MQKRPLPEFAPDSALLDLEASELLENVYPSMLGYGPVPSFEPIGNPAPETPLGGISFKDSAGAAHIIIGTKTSLYLLDPLKSKWVNISKKGVSYDLIPGSFWSFVKFGYLIIAVCPDYPPQAFDIRSVDVFRDLGGNPPEARSVTVWENFVVLQNIKGHPNRIMWSGLDDAEWWTVGQRSCDYQDFADGGAVMGSTSSSNPIIFLENAIYFGTFNPASSLIFTFANHLVGRGAKAERSIISLDEGAFFLSQDGFCHVNRAGAIDKIGFGKVDKYLAINTLVSDSEAIFGCHDPVTSRVYWGVRLNNVHDYYDTLLAYDYTLQKWAMIKVAMHLVMPLYVNGIALEQLDIISKDLDKLPYSLDSKIWQSGGVQLGACDKNLRIGTFSGKPMPATIQTQEISIAPLAYARLKNCSLFIDNIGYEVQIGHRSSLQEKIHWEKEQKITSGRGATVKHYRDRYFTVRFKIQSDLNWNVASAWSYDLEPAGLR